MPDPIDELENFNPGAPMNPLSPSEVRRLGDRHRRRRTAGIALAAAAAVAVIATGSVVLAGGGEPQGLDPAPPNPSESTASGPRIPDSLDITVDLYENESGEPATQRHGDVGLTLVDFCGVTPFADDGRADSVSAATSGPEYSDTREVVLYADEQSAGQALERLTAAARDCPRQESGPDNDTLHRVESWDAGESGVLVVRTYTNSLGAEIMRFTRVGDALLASSTYAEYDPSNTASGEADQARRLKSVVDQMCVFTDAGCATTTEPPASEPPATEPPADTDDIPADFPLAAGWPDRHEPDDRYGLTGPAPDVPVLEALQACGAALPAAASLDRLGAAWANVEDYRYRLLLTFEDADGAIDYQRQLVDAYRACPRTEDGESNASLNDVRQTRVGGESWAVVRTFEFLGAPAIGMEVIHVVRLGRALLVDTAANEGGGGPDPEAQATAQIAEQTAETSAPLAAMCAFTEAGC
ncbi:hypothetical protein NSZ01_34700 [Nocardioides szechwanensis]|uniref:PknH-like extracellular domain-containing protein n=1 Tax=Nocardioides szechwanensis TaxID=1005944 RepID=A0A1H0G4L9_9ACTN|nr:hypothetical protein [Nocardioides szechwanensis]GEP35702.1 hypothetical protein NSZ01_34700 [Nocardioides szechwanensis]SDO01817.1 hypothetical protein SAMN05192576_3251 [Nocardioides szechwanensis]